MSLRRWWLAGLLGIVLVLATQFISIIVVQPVGAVPDGATVIITRPTGVNFIDSPDGWCLRNMGAVSLMCRGMAGARIISNSTILARLPYSERLYLWSTDGKKFDR